MMLTHFIQCHISIPPGNIRKPLVFWRFQGVWKCDTGLKWVNRAAVNISALSFLKNYKYEYLTRKEISSDQSRIIEKARLRNKN